jgi:predicted permease
VSSLAELARRVVYLVRRNRFERDLEEEFRFHVREHADDLVRAGVPPDEAIEAARRAFGPALHVREEARTAWQFRWLEDLLADVRYALRMLRRSPAFTLTAVATLALGIGANTAIFSIVNAVVLRPLPYDRPEAVMIVGEKTAQFEQMSVSYLNFLDWRARTRAFRGLAAFRGDSFVLTGSAQPERVGGRLVSGDFFSVLGVAPQAGRLFSAENDRHGADPTVVISDRLWRRRFGGDPSIVGRAVTINDTSYTVIGVLPPSFWFYTVSDVFVPIGLVTELWTTDREMRTGMYVVGRLRTGVPHAQAQGDMDTIARALATAYPKANGGHLASVTPIVSDVLGGNRVTLYLLLGAVGFVLLIACANVANLLLARSASRHHEIAIRAALGAGRGRIVRQMLTESLILALAGASIGLAVVACTVDMVVAWLPADLPRSEMVGIDLRVLLFTVAVSLATGLVFGLLPALKILKTDLRGRLTERSRASGRHILQDLLVTAETALALLLMIGAGLMLQTVARLWEVNPGFSPRNTLAFSVSTSPVRYDSGAKVRRFYADLLDRLRGLPGVEAAAVSADAPLRGDAEIYFYCAERPRPPEDKDLPWAIWYPASSGYLRAMGLTLMRGRFIGEQDAQTSAPIVVVDEALARGIFPGDNPIGKHLIIPFKGLDQPREIVGVVKHVKHWGLARDDREKIQYQFYMPIWQVPDEFWTITMSGGTVVVRSAQDPSTLVKAVTRQVQLLDKDQPLYAVNTMSEMIATSLGTQRFAAWLLGLFAIVAVVLSAVGTYGVVAYSVARRTNEIGIRMALGASRRDVLLLVVGQGARRAALGVAIGAVAAVPLTRLLSGLLFKVSSTDPAAFASGAALLMIVALAASFVPARRAIRVDPTVALRAE